MDYFAFESGAGCAIVDQGVEPNLAYMLVATESYNLDGDMDALGSSCEESDCESMDESSMCAEKMEYHKESELDQNNLQSFQLEESQSMMCEDIAYKSVADSKAAKNRPKEIEKEIKEGKKYSDQIKEYLKENCIQSK